MQVAPTLRELIATLQDEGDLDQPVVYQYFLKGHVEYMLEDYEDLDADKLWEEAANRVWNKLDIGADEWDIPGTIEEVAEEMAKESE